AAIVVASVVRFPRPNYALDPRYTDHLQHEYSAWAFLHIGLRIYDTPKSDWGNVHAAHVHLLWEQLPSLYPPGLVAFFMPAGVALLGIYWVEGGKPGRALLALVLGLSLQYRLWYLWPLVLLLVVERRREIARWQLATAGLVAAASGVTFGLSVPFVSKFHD